jgi:hypothetical protein
MEGSARGSCRLALLYCSTPGLEGCSPCLAYILPSLMDGTMRCAICNDPLDISDLGVLPTTDGYHVHLRCADREARAAARQRTIHAMVSAIVFAGLFSIAIVLRLGLYENLLLALLLTLVHVSVNRRWWHYTFQSIRRWRLRW